MKTSRNTRLAAAGAAVAALAAAGAAVGASKLKSDTHTGASGPSGTFVDSGSGPSSAARPWHRFGGLHGHRGDDLAAAATYLGLTQDALVTQLRAGKTLAQVANATSGKSASGLVDALVASEEAELAQAVTDGRLTQAQADAVRQGLQQRITDRVNRAGPGGPDGPGPHHGPGDLLATASTYLGISQDALETELRSGKTLGAIADATSGKSQAGLVDALVAQEKEELAQAVRDGRLTQAQADQLAGSLDDRVTRLVDGTFPGRPDGPPPAPPAGDDHSA